MRQPTDFLRALNDFYVVHGRKLPWRQTADPYKILVSELMLQQTQVGRVVPKYKTFLRRFPDIQALAGAALNDVLAEWVGLGYNRRARYLHEAAKALAGKPGPWQLDDLVAQKGIGPNTAAAVLVYAYDLPLLFIETNVRTVIIHHFFSDRSDITDTEILEVLSRIAPWMHGYDLPPREFYWALMDYGTHLKATVGNLSRRSKHYARQSAFQGSRRQVRGQVIRQLLAGPKTLAELEAAIPDPRLPEVIDVLQAEKLVAVQDTMLMLYNET